MLQVILQNILRDMWEFCFKTEARKITQAKMYGMRVNRDVHVHKKVEKIIKIQNAENDTKYKHTNPHTSFGTYLKNKK